ncbi:hypothetical protein SPF06_00985 [Sinomonas sp. JGH33]|uniref:Uncharacterized protein n=1 Tax=Sinomonas terricola TaxID=3110330 RepID=A0ABU5T0V4_9MICC|nr:hypothetical protein [Sinomonas sp. JGH33]MEA5453285.1 hypothetical protein [Sinomonas sp. JGH33]
MPRIRTIKPEFWDSPSTAKASAVARLLFIAMWNWADDHGRGTLNLKELEGFAFPHDDIAELSSGKSRNFRDCVAEVSECFDVSYYEVGRRQYYAILKWEEHQRNERRAKSKFPAPEDGKIVEITREKALVTEVPPHSSGTSVQLHGSSGIGTGEQGNRGTGEIVPTSQPTVTRASRTMSDEGKAALRIVHAWEAAQTDKVPIRTVNDVTEQIQQFIAEGISHERIAAGLAEWWEGKYPPSTLANYVAKAGRQKLATGTKRAMETMAIDTSSITANTQQEEPWG